MLFYSQVVVGAHNIKTDMEGKNSKAQIRFVQYIDALKSSL